LKRRTKMLAVVLVLATLAASQAVAELGRDAPPSPIVYPPQELPLSFSHVRHLQRATLECTRCHTRAASSQRAADDLMPEEASCIDAACHAIDRSTRQGCAVCHVGWNGQGAPPALVVPTPHLKFAHELHVARKIACSECHGDPRRDNIGLATRLELPRMATCLGCHDGKTAPARCTTCHIGDASGRLQTDFPEGQLVPSGSLHGDAHTVDFSTQHGRVARSEASYCQSCHAERFCVECHDGRAKPLDFHAGDYQRLHAVDARRNTPRCSSCHRAQSFCTGCHARAGVTTDRRTGEFTADRASDVQGARFHPPGWQSGNVPWQRSSEHHAFQAQRNLAACASCHREDFCLKCHSAQPGGRARVSPHPSGWRSSRRCQALERKNPRVCLRCHVEGRTCDE